MKHVSASHFFRCEVRLFQAISATRALVHLKDGRLGRASPRVAYFLVSYGGTDTRYFVLWKTRQGQHWAESALSP
jgi:hypothetical protein